MKQGFTLIETMVAIAVFTLITLMAGGFIYYGYRVYDFTMHQAMATENAQRGIETMVKEIREAAEADTGGYVLENLRTQTLTFYSDIDKDEATERVRYFLDNTSLKRGVTEATGKPLKYLDENEIITTLSQYVRNGVKPVFAYYNGNWPTDTENNPLETPADVTATKLIHVYLIINVDPSRAPADFILESDVQIRNLKDNL